ncbi:hypothetical protein Aasi_0414 [Candidatus Amoebophilus asiaticus 5a2]|uniref:Uncharacterized protein n=1 Tax=Amoebophilus asiaticus (strain 5a2) TaxID=452471 RepID=B3ERH8_AMOA5|nr:hypothetical protein [Candidatus Amoebophilus asiaticus]ACE05830.1 hypothetical protein Aasi_0414 [Candidatus Amoebophilus asiaticus 5a2]
MKTLEYKKEYEVKAQVCELSDALHRNINDNFKSVSLEIYEDRKVLVRIILSKRTQAEEEYIEDLGCEFEMQFEQTSRYNDLIDIEVVLVGEKPPLPHIVYQVKGFDPKIEAY